MALGVLPAQNFIMISTDSFLNFVKTLNCSLDLVTSSKHNCSTCMWHSAGVNIFWVVKVRTLETINYLLLLFSPALYWFQLPWQAKVSFSSWGKILNDSDKHSQGTWLIHLMKHKLLCFWNKSAVGLNKGCSRRAGTGFEMHRSGDFSWPCAGLTLTHRDKNALQTFPVLNKPLLENCFRAHLPQKFILFINYT